MAKLNAADRAKAEAEARAKAEAEAQIMLSRATSEADWEKIMAQGSNNSWKDEWLTILFSIPLILVFTGDWGRFRHELSPYLLMLYQTYFAVASMQLFFLVPL